MKLMKNSLQEFLVEMASRKPIPAGGSAAALAGSLAAALLTMVGHLTDTERGRVITVEAEAIRQRLERLVDEDASAFWDFFKATGSEKETALKKATLIPLETATLSYRVLELASEIIRACRKSVITDAGTAVLLAEAAVHSACFNTATNLNSIQDAHFKGMVDTKLKSFTALSAKRRAIINYVNRQLQ